MMGLEQSSGAVAERGIGSWKGPHTRLGWICTAVAVCCWIYAAVIGCVFTRIQWPSPASDRLAEWAALPVQFAALLLVALLLLFDRRLRNRDRVAWFWVLGFATLSPVAAYAWNTLHSEVHGEVLGVEDGIYLLDYWTLTIAFAIWYLRDGGSFKRGRAWLDALTMVVVLLVGIWSFFLGPSVVNGTGRGISVGATCAYSMTIACMMSMAALLCLQMPTFRARLAVLLLVGAGVVDVAWEIMWMASWLTDRDFVGPYYNFGDVLCFAAVSSAAAATQFRKPRPGDSRNPERQVDSFLPALAVLVGIALVAGSVATTRRWDGWILVGLVVLCALLLITRQQSARKELRSLNRELARREADARLIELVRRSADLIMVVDADGMVTFASPATEPMLGAAPRDVQNMRAIDLFGPDHRNVLANLLERVTLQASAQASTEMRVHRIAAKPRVFKLSAVNQLDNQLINGIVLTVTDVTEQRMLEHEVLDVASRERVRLAGEIHDGLGQELVGIAMLLHAAATSKDAGAAATKIQLQTIVGHINRVVSAARDLARGLSPLSVVRGSLSGALSRLVPESSASLSVSLQVDPACNERVIDDFRADHLYRIAQEAVSNAMRHSGCTCIDIALRRSDSVLTLAVTDNGGGFGELLPDYPGLGLRLMEYRTRIIGGTLHIHHALGRGTTVEAMVPAVPTGAPSC
jgi:two-component system CheB/CheR fusion protein